ncbi:hypothetical protein BCR34DRAFT_608025 [Clohesyomyces aquaticus]|uniref:DUF4211 domain-containing protein n=1 Tax=Clohesyomyces aquaticus TaxID=1231657 RepID=A0A1Y1YAZ5_9PLEO|nr:hypothetical protein BCR34DRAFT_608025 [Clohesyomyces aquaticus]
MAPKRRRDNKRQSKINFSPLPTSSPRAARHLSPPVRNRATAVTLDMSPSKKRKLDLGRVIGTRDLSDTEEEAEFGLPTPKKSFQSQMANTIPRRESRRGLQLGMPLTMEPHGMFGSENEQLVPSSGASVSSGDERQKHQTKSSSKKSREKSKKAAGRNKAEEAKTNDGRKSTRKPSKRTRSTVEEPDTEDAPTSRRTRSAKIGKPAAEPRSNTTDSVFGRPSDYEDVQLNSESSDSDAMPDTTPPRRVRQSARARQRQSSFEVPDDVVEEEESEDDAPIGTQRRRPTRQHNISEEGDTEEEEVRTPGRRLNKKALQPDVSSDSDEDDEENPVRGSSRKNNQKISRTEQAELEEDLDFLQSSPPPENGRLRNKSARPLNARQKALEALKRRRAGPSAGPSSSAPSASSVRKGKNAIVLSDSDDDLDIIEEEDEDGTSTVDEDEASDEVGEDEDDAWPHGRAKALDMFQEDQEDEDFVVEEDENGENFLGVPAHLSGIPLEFTSMNSKKPRELFKYAVEWMVKKKISPAFSSTDDIYTLTFRKLDDEVNGLVNSKFSSSVWTPEFTRALRARPNVDISEISALEKSVAEPHCMACNRTKHPATFHVAFSGKAYNMDTLEPLYESEDEKDSTSDDDSDSDSDSVRSVDSNGHRKEYNANGDVLPPESTVFTLGSTCKANAQVAHTLRHWRYHLYSWVVDYLVSKGHQTAEKLAKRDKMSERKREKTANRIVDKMEKDGQIKTLHALYRDQIDFALEAKTDQNRGWGRRG